MGEGELGDLKQGRKAKCGKRENRGQEHEAGNRKEKSNCKGRQQFNQKGQNFDGTKGYSIDVMGSKQRGRARDGPGSNGGKGQDNN